MMMPLVVGLRLITVHTVDNADYFGTHHPALATTRPWTVMTTGRSFLMSGLYLFEPSK